MGSRGRKRKLARVEKESSLSSCCKITKNGNQDEQRMQMERMSEDANVLYSHFPEEIWLLITDKVTDSNTLDSLMNASPVFRNLLLPRRVEFLFPQVWKVLGVKFEEQEEEVYSYNFDEMHPGRDLSRFFLWETPWFSRVLTLRLVCKSWCRGVDEFYQNLPDNDNYRMKVDREIEVDDLKRCDKWSRGQRMGEWTFNDFFFGLEQIADDFVAHFDPTHFESGNQKSPIINRKIYISYSTRNSSRRFFSFLSKYGQHFWFCEVNFYDDFQTRVAFYADLKEMLELLPNLKTLKVRYSRGQKFVNRSWGEVMVNKYPSKLEIRQLKKAIVSHPLPKLHQLEFLSVKNFPTSIFKALVSTNTQISMLEVQQDDVQEGYDIYTFPMPNLKQLSMKYFSKMEFENLNKPEVDWALEKIYLNFRSCDIMRWSEIFSLLENKWATTLKNVAIYFPSTTRDHPNVSSTTLNLPNVQRFRLASQEIFSLDFILPMKSLQFLEVALAKLRQSDAVDKQLRLLEKNQVVQFVGHFKRFHNSNVWNLFPNLKSFKLIDVNPERTIFQATYTRQGCWSNGEMSTANGPITRQKSKWFD